MSRSKRTTLKYFFQGLSKLFFLLGACFFLFGRRALHEFGAVERVLAEFLGLAIAAALSFGGYMAKSAIEDLEWEEAKEEGIKQESEPRSGRK